MGDLGLFPQKQSRTRGAPAAARRAPAEPVVLKPYVPRTAIQYEVASREELIAGKGGTLIFDTECFTNLFLVAFKDVTSKKVTSLKAPFDDKKLRWILQNYTCVGFNTIKYDLPLLWAALADQDTTRLKLLSNDLIGGMRSVEAAQKYSFNMYAIAKGRHIDLIEVCPLHGSLKLYGARLHAKRIQDVPWAEQQALEEWQIPVTIDYCVNDLDTTELLFSNLTEQLKLRTELSVEYKQDLMSKSDAQIAEAVIGSELRRLKGSNVPRPRIKPGAVHKFVPAANLTFDSDYMNGVLKVVTDASFVIDDKGYLICPDEISNLEIKLGGSVYRMGIGGLHSSEKTMALLADENHILIDRDVAGYYPRIVLNCRLTPKNLGADFLTVYKGLVDRRMEAKRTKNISVSENLKVAVNGTFGKTGSPHSILYAPEVIVQILLGGQLYLLMLIELMEAAGVPVVSANTDGIVMRCPKSKQDDMLRVIKEWETVTGFETEETQYKAIYARDVNAYLAVKSDGTIKGKNVFYDPWRDTTAPRDRYWRFQKNPTCQICAEAVENLITRSRPLIDTIKLCTDITRFVAIKNVTGGAHWNGEYLGRVVRWYYAKNVTGTINYITNNRIVGDTEGARPLMDLPDQLPDDIDYDYYVRRAEGLLRDMGYITGG